MASDEWLSNGMEVGPQIGAQKGPLHAYDDPALITLEPEAEG